MTVFIAAIAALFAPYVDAEMEAWLEPHTIVDSSPANIAKGTRFRTLTARWPDHM
jgi:hypothetical protein